MNLHPLIIFLFSPRPPEVMTFDIDLSKSNLHYLCISFVIDDGFVCGCRIFVSVEKVVDLMVLEAVIYRKARCWASYCFCFTLTNYRLLLKFS